MFSIGDYVLNQETGHIGQVVGFGSGIFNGVESRTLKVLIAYANNSGKRGVIEEDVDLIWVQYLNRSSGNNDAVDSA